MKIVFYFPRNEILKCDFALRIGEDSPQALPQVYLGERRGL